MTGSSEDVTAREQEVLNLLSEGLANKEIADALGCSVRTVEFHISNLLRKVGVTSRLELVARGRRDGAIDVTGANGESPLIEIRVFSGLAAAVLGDTLVYMWSTPATTERWVWWAALIDERIAAHEDGVLAISLVLPTSTPPDSTLRVQMRRDFHRYGPKLRRFVGVPLGDSIWMAIVRTIARTVMAMSGRSGRQVLASSVDQGLNLLLEAAGPNTPPRSELERAVAELSRLLGVSNAPASVQKVG